MEFLQNITPRKYQEKIFETCKEKNCLVVLPTGLGKTLIAVMLTIERLQKFPGEKVVILAPTKPLVEQHFKSFKKYLPELFAEIEIFTGTIKPDKRRKIWETSDIIFSTPQCVANDLKNRLYNLEEVCLLVEDEAHRCVKNYDYNYIANTYRKQAKNQRIIGLTASPGNEIQKIKEICRNLSIEEVELRTRESEDVKGYLQELEFERINVEFPPEFVELRQMLLQLSNNYLEELRKRKVLFGYGTKTELIKIQKRLGLSISKGNKNFNNLLAVSACAQAIKINHAIELLETQTISSLNDYLKKLFNQAAKHQSKGVERLVAKPEFNYVYTATTEMLAKKTEHPKVERIFEIVEKEFLENKNSKIIIFTQFRDTAQTLSNKLKEIEGVKPKIFVGQAKRTSSSKKETGLSQKQQQKIIEDFSTSKVNVLCATCIAEEGLDIPEVNAVIFYESIPSAIRAIQRAGRTARLKKGKLIILITKKTRDETFYYISRGRQKNMESSIKKIREDLKNNKKFDFQKRLK